MRKMKTEAKSSKAVKLLNIIIVITVLAAVIMLVRMVSEIRRSFDRDPYNSMEYSLRDGDYASMVRNYYYRGYDIAPFKNAYEEEYHVAEYADAAFRHQFFHAVGNTEMANRFEARMEAARSQCGSVEVSTHDIDRLLDEAELFP